MGRFRTIAWKSSSSKNVVESSVSRGVITAPADALSSRHMNALDSLTCPNSSVAISKSEQVPRCTFFHASSATNKASAFSPASVHAFQRRPVFSHGDCSCVLRVVEARNALVAVGTIENSP